MTVYPNGARNSVELFPESRHGGLWDVLAIAIKAAADIVQAVNKQSEPKPVFEPGTFKSGGVVFLEPGQPVMSNAETAIIGGKRFGKTDHINKITSAISDFDRFKAGKL